MVLARELGSPMSTLHIVSQQEELGENKLQVSGPSLKQMRGAKQAHFWLKKAAGVNIRVSPV